MSQPRGHGTGDTTRTGDARCAELDSHFRSSFRALWLTAVAIVGDSATAEDVVQEAAVIALSKLDAYESGTNFAAWAGQIVRNVAFNRARSERRRRSASGAYADHQTWRSPGTDSDGRSAVREGQLEIDDFSRRVMIALGDVADIPRACLLLRTVEGLSYGEISALLEIPEGTAMSHVHRTRLAMREKLSEPPINLPNGAAGPRP